MFNLLPYLAVTRQAFIYHYMPALFYGVLLLCIAIEVAVPKQTATMLCTVLTLAAVAAYLFFSPWIYGFKMIMSRDVDRRWLSTWD
jgi:dolichyl-phosphate-mannose-protein mannosyltransferase